MSAVWIAIGLVLFLTLFSGGKKDGNSRDEEEFYEEEEEMDAWDEEEGEQEGKM